MSYLDEWLEAWKLYASNSQVFNVLKVSEIKTLKRTLFKFDLVVVLHSVSADSNKWLDDLSYILSNRKCPVILFVGNEYSNPWLSIEVRLKNIAKVAPEIIATQLPQKSGDFLYEGIGSRIVETPHALPINRRLDVDMTKREIDLGFRGFDYPWFLLDSDRNKILMDVSNLYSSRNLTVDVSTKERLDKDAWYSFLHSCKTTVASEGGSGYIFRNDEVWVEALRFLETTSSKKLLANDFPGAKILRTLPVNVKKNLRSIGKFVGKEQGATSILPPPILEEVLTRINVEDYQFVSGKALTSRHLDAIFCGTWQILTPGDYNGVLTAGIHYSEWDEDNPLSVLEEVEEAVHDGKSTRVYEELILENSHRSRINKLLDRLKS
jgi:hypothetical protein